MGYFWIVLLLPAFFAGSHGDCDAPPRLDYAELDAEFSNQNTYPINANITYKCRLGYISEFGTSNVITCLSNSTWSIPVPFCKRRSCGDPGHIENGEVSDNDRLFGSTAVFTCNPGYNMLSKRNYRECQADGKWSNDVPVCEVQKCPPPIAITDGRYAPEKEEYNYQDAVQYSCNEKTSSLIGERSLFCTAHGNWSSDPPQCKAVKCEDPEVKDAIKLSGFTGPYVLDSAIRYECKTGFTMIGEPSITCSENNQWKPSPPSCVITGNNTGAIVGGVIAGIVVILLAAAAIYVRYFKNKSGSRYIGPNRKKPDSGTSGSQPAPVDTDMKQIEAQEIQ